MDLVIGEPYMFKCGNALLTGKSPKKQNIMPENNFYCWSFNLQFIKMFKKISTVISKLRTTILNFLIMLARVALNLLRLSNLSIGVKW